MRFQHNNFDSLSYSSMSRIDDVAAPPSKLCRGAADSGRGGARILSLLLRAAVMTIFLAVFLFFVVAAAGLLFLNVFVSCCRRQSTGSRFNYRPVSFTAADDVASTALITSRDCAVCLDGFRDGDWCGVLPACGHVYHASCLDKWLVRSPACPVCRRGVGVAAS